MQVNTAVVKALMYLRGIGEAELANITHTTLTDLQCWLYDQGEDSDAKVSMETQLEILKILGIGTDAPRGDVVHYWRIHEPLFSKSSQTYWPLQVILKAFGRAQVVYVGREADPFISFQAKAHFGLRFENFMAILEITAHPLRSISFDPETMPDLSWVPETFGVLLPDGEYDRLEPGAMKVRGMTQYLTYTTEMSQWEKLREAALENGIRAEQVAALLLGNSGADPLLAHKPSSSSTETPEQERAPQAAPAAKVVQQAMTPKDDDISLFVTPVKPASSR